MTVSNAEENSSEMQAIKHKDCGNEAFKKSLWSEAIKSYSAAIKLGEQLEHKELPIFYKNRAAAYLKLEQFNEALLDCNKSLELAPRDPKALYRRAQAHEGLEKYEEAYKDATDLFKEDASNKSVQPMLQRLYLIVQERSLKHAQTSNKVQKMMDLTFDFAQTLEKRRSGANNLLVLAKENFGAEALCEADCISKIASGTKQEKDVEIYANLIRVIAELCYHSPLRTKKVLTELGVPWFLQVLNHNDEERILAAQYCLQTIINALSGLENKPDSKPDKELCEKYQKEIDTLLTCLLYSVTDPTISGPARDAVIEILTRNLHYTALSWAERLVELRGLHRLMDVCSELEEYRYESSMPITSSSRSIASVCLARIYENMYYDKLREKFQEQIDEYVKDKLLDPDLESKVRVTVAITSLLLGPLDVGNQIIAREGKR